MSLDAIPLNPFPPFILHNFIVLFHPFFRVSVVNLRATLATIEKLAHAQLTFQNLLSNDRPTKATERTSFKNKEYGSNEPSRSAHATKILQSLKKV